jgi:hypothetical protein
MSDLDDLAGDLHASLVELADVAGVELETAKRGRRRRASRANGHKPGGRIGTTSAEPGRA